MIVLVSILLRNKEGQQEVEPRLYSRRKRNKTESYKFLVNSLCCLLTGYDDSERKADRILEKVDQINNSAVHKPSIGIRAIV